MAASGKSLPPRVLIWMILGLSNRILLGWANSPGMNLTWHEHCTCLYSTLQGGDSHGNSEYFCGNSELHSWL